MRRLPFPMAIQTAFEMCQGKMSLKDYGSAPKTWAFFYSLFTCSTGARLSRAKETQAAHQHTYSTLLLHLMPGSRHHGVLASLLHILAQNPEICDVMPQLTKPKKVSRWAALSSEEPRNSMKFPEISSSSIHFTLNSMNNHEDMLEFLRIGGSMEAEAHGDPSVRGAGGGRDEARVAPGGRILPGGLTRANRL